MLNDAMRCPRKRRGGPIRIFSPILGTLFVLTLHLGCSREPTGPQAPQQVWQELAGSQQIDQLSVILISIDTLRADRLSSYGSTRVATPNIDRLATEGVRFTNASSTVPFTLPAHSSIMTGTYPPFHGVRENVGYFLDDSLATLAGQLSQNGWSTGGFVSAFVLDSRWGIGQGFDTYFDDFDPEETSRGNLGSVQRDGTETIAAAVEWLDSSPQAPFFLWLHLYDPHDPYTPSEPYKSQYRHPYDAEVAYTDALIGQFRQALDERGLLETSLLVLTSDHGEGLGQHQEGFHGFFIYDSTVRVPLIIQAPFGNLAGRVVEDAVSHVDLLPTILEAVGVPIPEQAQGASLLPAMLELEPDSAPERLVYSESLYPLLHYGWAPVRSIRSRQFKFIDTPEPELYDLLGDPDETNNALLDQRRVSRELKDALDAMSTSLESGGVAAEATDLDEDTMRQLQALGYVAGRGGMDLEDIADHDRADPKDRIRLHQLVMAAQSDLGAEDPEAAETKLREALGTDDSLLDAHQMLGTIAMQREEFEQATVHFQTALAQKVDHTPAILGLANAYLRLQRKDEALVGFQRLLELSSTDSNAALGAADLLVERQRPGEAVAILEAALDQERPAPILLSVACRRVDPRARGCPREPATSSTSDRGQRQTGPSALQPGGDPGGGRPTRRCDDPLPSKDHELALALPGPVQSSGRLHGHRQGGLDRQQQLYEAAIEANPDFYRGYFYLAKLIMDRGGDLQRAESPGPWSPRRRRRASVRTSRLLRPGRHSQPSGPQLRSSRRRSERPRDPEPGRLGAPSHPHPFGGSRRGTRPDNIRSCPSQLLFTHARARCPGVRTGRTGPATTRPAPTTPVKTPSTSRCDIRPA